MDRKYLTSLLNAVADKQISLEDAVSELENLPYQDLGYAKIDHHRGLRNGNSEVIYCPGKSLDQITAIFQVLAEKSQNVIATRASRKAYIKIKERIPDAEYFETARIIALWRDKIQTEGIVGVVSAGTADMRVAEEASVTAELMGSRVQRIYDVGVAGIHRLLSNKQLLDSCRVLIVVAGMEGALASVVGGLVSKPIVAVPTDIGYGANFKGIAPLLSMLNSCASGIGVVNINNGFGAGILAHRINLIGEMHENTLS
jgi:NCAIR mutase (PurE)-related protein